MSKMPEVNTEMALNEIADYYDDFDEGEKIFNIVVKRDNTIRATRPTIDKNDPITGKAAYVWRMVCFMVSSRSAHQCMPMSADFYLPSYNEDGKWRCELARKMAESLRPIEDAIINGVKKSEWHGIRRWGKILI